MSACTYNTDEELNVCSTAMVDMIETVKRMKNLSNLKSGDQEPDSKMTNTFDDMSINSFKSDSELSERISKKPKPSGGAKTKRPRSA